MPPPRIKAHPQRAAFALILPVLLILLLSLLGLFAWLVDRMTPTQVASASHTRLACVSYAPFRNPRHSPFNPQLIISPESIRSDLMQLAQVSNCVRTYGLDHGLDAVPQVARELGMRVILGAWISRDAKANDAQVKKAIALSRSHSDVIDLLVVGNEVLLRREMSAQELADLLKKVKQESYVPITYADVWEFWLRNAHILQSHVNLIAAHILPYWEDEPVHINNAVSHVHQIYSQLQARFDPMPVLIAETGWPAAGRPRGPAVPSAVNQSRFVREMLSRPYPGQAGISLPGLPTSFLPETPTHFALQPLGSEFQGKIPLPFNLIEGFDQPWKRQLEGAMGGAWGLFSWNGQQRVQFQGAVIEDLSAGWAFTLGALFGLAGFFWAKRHSGVSQAPAHASMNTGIKHVNGHVGDSVVRLVYGLICSLIGILSALQIQALFLWSRSFHEWVTHSAIMFLGVILSFVTAARLINRMIAHTSRADLISQKNEKQRTGFFKFIREPQILTALHFTWLCVLLGLIFALLIDGRYRALPWATIMAPAVLLLSLGLFGDSLQNTPRYLSVVLALCAPLILISEGPHNHQAWLLVALLLLTAAAGLLPKHLQEHAGKVM